MIKVFKGDDTGGTLGKPVMVEIISDRPLDGCTIVFSFCGVVREYTGVASGDKLEIFFSHNDTQMMPVGISNATIKARDAAGKIRTLTNSLPIKVTTNLAECYGGDNSVQVNISNAVNWDSITGLPFDGKTISLATDDDIVATVGAIIEKLGGQVK